MLCTHFRVSRETEVPTDDSKHDRTKVMSLQGIVDGISAANCPQVSVTQIFTQPISILWVIHLHMHISTDCIR